MNIHGSFTGYPEYPLLLACTYWVRAHHVSTLQRHRLDFCALSYLHYYFCSNWDGSGKTVWSVKVSSLLPNPVKNSYLVDNNEFLNMVTAAIFHFRFIIATWTDQRINTLNEVFSGMRVIKMYVREPIFRNLVSTLRR